jgi:dTDP-4-dehydrorhamnose 3,5-epimerase
MRLEELALAGAYLVTPEPARDDRGAFIRHFDVDAFEALALCTTWKVIASAVNTKRGTLRGLHFQAHPAREAKVVRCTQGALWDVMVDLRDGSRTRGHWYSAELSRANGLMLYIPEGFGHGYLTLEDDTEIEYLLSAAHEPSLARGLRWNDPGLGIQWPFAPSVLCDRDATWPLWEGTL